MATTPKTGFAVDLRNYDLSKYEKLYSSFKWPAVEHFSLADALCDQHAGQEGKIAVYHYSAADKLESRMTYAELSKKSKQLANFLVQHGLEPGDRVGIMLPQCPELAVSLIAAHRAGAVHMTMSVLSGVDALEYRLRDSEAKILIIDARLKRKFEESITVPSLKRTVVVGDARRDETSFDAVKDASQNFQTRENRSGPSMIFYSSGTTGRAKGILHSQKMVLGLIPCWQLSYGLAPREGDIFWGPAEWAWLGGLGNLVFPAWYFGMPVVALERMERFDPAQALLLIQEAKITACYFVPTVLRLMKKRFGLPRKEFNLDSLRVIASGSEPVGPDLVGWSREALGVPLNELYGLTEADLVLGNCSEIMRTKPGSLGKPVPGHRVEVMDESGRILPPNAVGEIAVESFGDPVIFLGYWKSPEATRQKFRSGWFLTGDVGYRDEEGYFWFIGRNDDVIKSAAYRVGPAEVEEAIDAHPAVLECGVIGRADADRGTVIRAYVVLRQGYDANDATKASIQDFVKDKLAAYAYPRDVEFIASLPKTSTGKIMRGELRRIASREG